jgi:hypothetical protein
MDGVGSRSPVMPWVHQGFSWIAGWALTSVVIGLGLVGWTLVRGGSLHRVPICGYDADANVYALAIEAGGAALIVVILYWALGAHSIRWRWVRLAGSILAAVPISIAIVIRTQLFWYACMGGAPPLG